MRKSVLMLTMLSTLSLASGTGVVVSNNGYILTNKHVSDNGGGAVEKVLNFWYNGKIEQADFVISEAKFDLALYKLRSNQYVSCSIVASSDARLNEPLYVKMYDLSKGDIYNIFDKPLYYYPVNDLKNFDLLKGGIVFEFQNIVFPGNSGSPLYNKEGYIAGIARAKSFTSLLPAFAIPASSVKTFLETNGIKCNGGLSNTVGYLFDD